MVTEKPPPLLKLKENPPLLPKLKRRGGEREMSGKAATTPFISRRPWTTNIEIDQSSSGITEEIEKCRDSALERKRTLEDDKERFQKAAYSVLNMLNNRESS